MSLTTLDWIALAIVLFSAFAGWRRGLIASALSLVGLAAGAYAGSRAPPHLLRGGARGAAPPPPPLHLPRRTPPSRAMAGPAAPDLPPSPSVLRDPVIRRASNAVVRVIGTACGVGVEGTGWFVRDDLVVTAAHVV